MKRTLSLGHSFLLWTVFFGLCIETLAIFENISKPLDERILLSPYPMTDLFFAIFYYGLVGLTWYALLKRVAFNKTDVFLLTGIILGLGTEQGGAILIGMFSSLTGFLMALVIVCVYGIFPTLAYTCTERRFGFHREPKKVTSYIVAAGALFLQWAIFGIIVLPLLKHLVSLI